MHTWSWDDICTPKKEGGYKAQKSVKNCGRSWYKVSLEGMYFKELLKQMDASNYLKVKHISEAQCTLLDSGTCKWIIQSKTNALQVICKKVGNRQDAYIWLDSWLSMGKLLDHVDRAPHRTVK